MELSDILLHAYTDEEYLAHQRQLHRARIEAAFDELRRAATPTHIEGLRRAAAPASEHRFVFPGTGGELFDVGTPPAWHEQRTDDEEYVWALNRTHWFKTWSELYVLTGEECFAESTFADLENWIDSCPLPPLPREDDTHAAIVPLSAPFCKVTPWRTLEVGIRVFDSWNIAYERLLFSAHMTPERHTKMVCSFYEHAKVLRVMSPYFWPRADHNHYLHEMLGLLQITCLFPDFKQAPVWQPYALHELGRCVDFQLTEDGGQVEGSPNYHSGCLSMFFEIAALARAYGLTLPDNVLRGCQKGAVYEMFTIQPNGYLSSVGDTAMDLYRPNAVTRYYKCFGELGPTEKLLAIYPPFAPQDIPEQVQQAARAVANSAPGEDNYQRTLGQYMARTGWRRTDSYLHFICCTPVVNGHAHQDPMSFALTLQGDPVVIDPSYFTYKESPERKLFKSPEYHSCLTFDDKPPFAYVNMWGYTPQKEGSIRRTYRGEGFFAADASHHGYDPDYHKRLCLLVGDDTCIIVDDVINCTGTDVRLYFHMDDPATRIEGDVAVNEHVRVLLPQGLTAEVLASRKAKRCDVGLPSARIKLTDTSHTHAQYVTVFTKREDITHPTVRRTEGGLRIRYQQGEQTVSFLWSFSCALTRE